MDHFVTPTRRHQQHTSGDDPFNYIEVQLTVSIEDFLVSCWVWKDLLAFLTGGETPKILWITDNVFLLVEEGRNGFDLDDHMSQTSILAKIVAANGQEQTLLLSNCIHSSIVVSTREVDVFWRAITTSNCAQLLIYNDSESNRFGLPAGPLLSQFLRGNPSLRFLRFECVHFKEDHCRALMTLARTNLEVAFVECKFEPRGAQESFIEWFRHNRTLFPARRIAAFFLL
jgi:hypothetical protein